jgi:hypothetical protein
MAYMKKETENRLLDLLTEATQVTKTLTDRVVELEATNEQLRNHNMVLTSALNVAVGAVEKFPRYGIDEAPFDREWYVIEDTTEGGYIASFSTLELAQEWVENHQEWLDFEPGVD